MSSYSGKEDFDMLVPEGCEKRELGEVKKGFILIDGTTFWGTSEEVSRFKKENSHLIANCKDFKGKLDFVNYVGYEK